MLAHLLLLIALVLPASASYYARPPENHPEWTTNHQPFRILGNVYYVGSQDLGAYLITTPHGHILLNENLASSVPQICRNIKALGFRLQDIKYLLNGQAHYDHTGGTAAFKQLTHAQVAVMAGDVAVMESGGHDDFFFFNDPVAWFTPVKVDRVLHDGSQIRLGNTVLTAHLTAGHTKGTTTWTMTSLAGQRSYRVVIVGGAGINEGNNLVHDARYPTQARDFVNTFRALRTLPCDIFLGAHGGYFDLEAKYARLQKSKTNPFIDPSGYRAFIQEREQTFQAELAKQTAKR
jgi:metallo-beta-lactamase class B